MRRTVLFTKKIIAVVTALLSACTLFAEYNSFNIPDSAEIREIIKNDWFTAPLSEVRSKNIEMRTNEIGTKFQIRSQEGVDELVVIVAPMSFLTVDSIVDGEHQFEQLAVFPEGAPGSWVLYRNKLTGKPVRICWYFNQDAEVYLQFRPDGIKTFCDLIIFNSFIVRSVPLGISFDKLYTSSFEDVLTLTKKRIPWDKVTVTPGQYHSILQMTAVIRENLPRINYAENACYNEIGELYSINTGKPFILEQEQSIKEKTNNEEFISDENRLTLCGAGFVKWIIDGLIEPRIGSGTVIGSLLEPTVSYKMTGKYGVMSQNYNLSFTLDWTRNLAIKELSTRTNRECTLKDGATDVKIEPFATELVNSDIINSAGYTKDTGYMMKRIKSVLYVLGISEPSYFYLAAIRQPSKLSRDEMVFNDSAVLFPYFDDTGRFGCIVFENGKEMTLDNFCGRHADSFIHLERVKSEESFFPR